jgi:lipoprotein-anchoring transpeptidase ErfK/SrfK
MIGRLPLAARILVAAGALALLAVIAIAVRGMIGSGAAPQPRVATAAPLPKPVAPRPATPARPAPSTPAPAPTPTPSDPTQFVLRRVLPVPSPFRHGDWVWDDAGVPDGPMVITVDLEAEVLSAFRDGYEIGAAVILYGADYKPTPLGTYPITQKDKDHRSNLYGGAPMPYMLRLTNDGVSIHGSDVALGAATHGCIGVPTPFARRLFAAVKRGDPVIVTRGKRIEVKPTA